MAIIMIATRQIMIGRLRYLNGRTQLLRLVIALLAVLALGSLGRAAEPSAETASKAITRRSN